MENSIVYALLSMIFAGITPIIAKLGLQRVHSDVAVTVRVIVIAILQSIWILQSQPVSEFTKIGKNELGFLILSGLTTLGSWLFYYRAIQNGSVAIVSLIDKSSVVLTIILSVLIFQDSFSVKTILSCLLILSGVLLLIWK